MAVIDVLRNSVLHVARRVGLRNPFVRHNPFNWSQPTTTKAHIDYQIDYGIRPDARSWRSAPGLPLAAWRIRGRRE